MLDYENCTGCMACLNVCPKNAISCVENDKGFIVPSINNDLCINCGLCDKTCVLNKEIPEGSTIQDALALVTDNNDVLKNSTSGGAFTALSNVILKKQGIVVGAIMDESFTVYHVLTTETSIRDRMRGSKYVQSNVKDLYRKIKENLESNVYVLFIGTPCQVHALRQFLRKDYDTLYAVDILCHGVPNNKMFKEHINYVNSFEGAKIVDYHFRTKRFGGRNSIQEYKLEDSKKYITSFDAQEYASFFRQSLSIRPSSLPSLSQVFIAVLVSKANPFSILYLTIPVRKSWVCLTTPSMMANRCSAVVQPPFATTGKASISKLMAH